MLPTNKITKNEPFDEAQGRNRTPNTELRVALLGADTPIAFELIRLLLTQSNIKLTTITSKNHTRKKLADVNPRFLGQTNLEYTHQNIARIAKHNHVAFLCTPYQESMELAFRLRKHGVKVIDLSPAFDLQNIKLFEKHFGKHTQKKLIQQAAYGLPEIFAKNIHNSYLVAIPSPLATASLLALAPLLQNQLIVPKPIICDFKQGGVVDTEIKQRFEMSEKLSLLAHHKVVITPSVYALDNVRELFATFYAQPIRKWKDDKLSKVYESFYKSCPYIHIANKTPQTQHITHTNNTHIHAHYDENSEFIIVTVTFDQLIKGSAGLALQCLNFMNNQENR